MEEPPPVVPESDRNLDPPLLKLADQVPQVSLGGPGTKGAVAIQGGFRLGVVVAEGKEKLGVPILHDHDALQAVQPREGPRKRP